MSDFRGIRLEPRWTTQTSPISVTQFDAFQRGIDLNELRDDDDRRDADVLPRENERHREAH